MPWPDAMTRSDAYAQPVNPERSREGSSRTKQDAEHVRGFVRDSQRASTSYGINPVLVSNVILLGIAALALSLYIVQANILAADKYKVKVLNEKLLSLNEVRTSLLAQRSVVEDPSGLMEFAKSRNMVEAKNITYLFENGNVALRR